jgi:ribosomal-protein-alanine N-acetyltransferase
MSRSHPETITLPPFTLRPMQVTDVPAVMAVERQVYAQPWSDSGYIYELTANELARYQALTARAGNRSALLIGYAGHWLIADEAHVSTIVVAPSWRRLGLGQLLMLDLLLRAHDRGACLATLEVRRSNRPAQALYLGLGFEVVGERPHYYADNREDALIMTLAPLDADNRADLQARWQELAARLAERQQELTERVAAH